MSQQGPEVTQDSLETAEYSMKQVAEVALEVKHPSEKVTLVAGDVLVVLALADLGFEFLKKMKTEQ